MNKGLTLSGIALLLATAAVHAEDLRVAGANEAIGTADVNNSTVGVGVDHWFDENFGAGIGVSDGAGFTVFEVRGAYMLDDQFYIAHKPARPYFGLGFASIRGDSYSYSGLSSTASGSGLELFGGAQWQTPWLKRMSLRAEARYSAFNVETTIAGHTFKSGYDNLAALASAVFRF